MLCYSGENCLDCGSLLKFTTDKPASITVYSSIGSSEIPHRIKVCIKKNCRSHYHYSYFTRKNVFFSGRNLAKFYYNQATKNTIFMSSSISAFMVTFLISLLTDMMLCPEYSFQQKAMAYNLSVHSGNTFLNNKRLMIAFMQFALLEMLRIYQPEKPLSSLSFSFDLDANLLKFTPSLKESFQKYHANHGCSASGCRIVIGWDADCKVMLFLIVAVLFVFILFYFLLFNNQMILLGAPFEMRLSHWRNSKL